MSSDCVSDVQPLAVHSTAPRRKGVAIREVDIAVSLARPRRIGGPPTGRGVGGDRGG